jgi:hypothetical protein
MIVSGTWSLILRKGEKNRCLRILDPKGEEVIEEGTKLHSEGLHNLYLLPNIIRLIKLWKMRQLGI